MLELGLIVVLFGIGAIGVVWSGFVLSILWGWFAVPIFGLPPIGLAGAIGVATVVGLLTHQYVNTSSDQDKTKAAWNAVGYMAIRPLFALITGFVVKSLS